MSKRLLPVYPTTWVPPTGMLAEYGTLVALTSAPDCLAVAFHMSVTIWPRVNVQRSVQPEIGLFPVLVIVTSALYPPFQR